VNGDLHIGHLAGFLIPPDIYARFNRLIGNDVAMVSGSDCYGTPTTVEADSRGVKPIEIVNEYHPKRLALFKKADIKFDIFTKTSTDNHKKAAQDMFLKLLEDGYIIKKTTQQFYSEKEKRFLPDRYVEGICPNCGYEKARSDQCENCGKIPEVNELKNPKSRISGSKIKLRDTEHYFLDWPKLQPFLEKYLKEKGPNWREWVRKETKGWLDKGLKPRAITRDLDWGVEIPADRIPKEQLIDNVSGKRIYVWFEAVIGYLSATIEWAKKEGRDWKDFWYPEDNSDVTQVHFMGKDNLVFHTLFWPGQLYGYDQKIHLPDVQAINQFLNLGEGKFSKSQGRIIEAGEIIDQYGVDSVRFYLTLIMPENFDTSFTWEDFKDKVNGILIANFGNFINRTLSQIKGEKCPQVIAIKKEIKDQVSAAFEKSTEQLSETKFRDFLDTVLTLSSYANKFINEEEPWKTKKDDRKRFDSTMANGLYLVLALSTMVKPLLPSTSEKIEKMLGVKVESWIEVTDEIEKAIKKIKVSKKVEPLFNKIEL